MSNSNPYEAPTGPTGPGSGGKEKVRAVAKAQRLVLLSLLAGIGLNIASYAIGGLSPIIQFAFLFLALAVIGFMVYAMYNLASQLNSTGIAILYAVLMIVPCVSLIMLLVVNQQATGFLTANGVKVGLMGADMNQFQ